MTPAVPAESEARPAPLASRYLLVIHVPVVVDPQGRRWIERLWDVDLARHTEYIEDLTVACPFEQAREPPPDSVPLPTEGLRFVEIAWPRRTLVALLRAPWTAWQVWRLLRRFDFVHSIYGNWWPLATPYLVNRIARALGKPLMVIVEASPWRIARGERASAWRRIQASMAETLNRWTLSQADLVVLTHEGYRRELMPHDSSRGHVIPASWIDEAAIPTQAEVQARWRARLAAREPLRLLFAGRLQEDKGVRVLLEAVRRLRLEGCDRMRVTIVGAGPLEIECRALQSVGDLNPGIEVLAPVAYGEPFFHLLRQHDAVLVPSLADEQPRIVFDAYSQGLPVIASSTPGLQPCVQEAVTGCLVPPADAAALALAMRRAAAEPAQLARWGLASQEAARAMTHQEMHRRRHVLISRLLQERGLA